MALLVAGTVPSRLNFLIMLDNSGPFSTAPEKIPIFMEKALSDRLRLLSRQPRTYKSVEEAVHRMLQSDAQLSIGAAKLLVDRATQCVSGGVQFSHDPRLYGGFSPQLTEEIVLAFIKRVSCPSMIIWASHRWYSLDHDKIRVRQDSFRNLIVLQVEGNHHVHLEHAERIVPGCVDFVINSANPSAKL